MQIAHLNNKIQKKRNPLSKFTSYFIVVFALMVVNPFFITATNGYLIIFCVILLMIALYKGIKISDKKITYVLMAIYFLIALQSMLYEAISPAAIYNPIVIFYVPFLIYRLLGMSFFKYLVNVLYFIAIYTTPIWLMQSFVPTVDNFMHDAIYWVFPYSWASDPRSLLIYTSSWAQFLYDQNLGIYRNSGIFHEPGAYAVFLILGIAINTLFRGKLIEKKNILFIFCLLTTLSTAGFISLFIIILSFFLKSKTNMIVKVIGLTLFLYTSYNLFENQIFLREKVITQYEDQVYAAGSTYIGKTTEKSGRFFAFYIGIVRIYQNPLFGQGILAATTPASVGTLYKGSSSGYGIIDILATYGILFGSFYFYYFYIGFKKIRFKNQKNDLFLVLLFIAVMSVFSSQALIRTTVMVTIFVLGLYSKSSKLNENLSEVLNKNAK